MKNSSAQLSARWIPLGTFALLALSLHCGAPDLTFVDSDAAGISPQGAKSDSASFAGGNADGSMHSGGAGAGGNGGADSSGSTGGIDASAGSPPTAVDGGGGKGDAASDASTDAKPAGGCDPNAKPSWATACIGPLFCIGPDTRSCNQTKTRNECNNACDPGKTNICCVGSNLQCVAAPSDCP